MKRITDTNKRESTILAFALIPLSGFAMDVYLPSLPDMALKLHTTPAAVQLTISIYLISYGVCQLLIGSLLDSYGRYLPSLTGLFLFTISSFVIARTNNIELIYMMRAIQGIMVAVIVVSKRASFIDLYTGEKLKHYTSLFSIIWAAAPIIAPFVGGFLQIHFGWHANFYFLGYFSLAFFLLELVLSGESLPAKQPFNLKVVNQAYISMIRTNDFTAGILILALSYSMVLVYGMASPFIIERILNYPATVTGNCALVSGVSLLAGGLFAKHHILKQFNQKVGTALAVQAIATAVLVVLTLFIHNIYTLLAYVVLLHSAIGFIFNTILSYCYTRFTNNGGKASGLAGGGYVVLTSAFSYMVVSSLSIKSQFVLGLSYGILLVCVVIVFLRTRWIGNHSNVKQESTKLETILSVD